MDQIPGQNFWTFLLFQMANNGKDGKEQHFFSEGVP
jgi:hypothetical protein